MIKRQRIMIIALAVVFAALAAVYFIVVRPLTQEEEPEDTTLQVDPGEGVYADATLVYPLVDRDDMQSIEVKNSYGSYKFVYNRDLDDFEIEGYESLAFNPLVFTRLVVTTGFTHVLEKVTNKATDENLAEYGFAGGESEPAEFTVTLRDGSTHTIKIGEKIISGGGYYAMYEGRDAIYILDSSLAATILVPVEAMLTPVVTSGVSSTTYYLIDNFTIKHYGEDFLVCRNLTTEELAETETTAMAESVTVYPAGYTLSMYYDDALQTLASYEGESVEAIGLTAENLEKYGLTDEPYVISYEYDGFKFKLTISEPVDGYYYVATSMFNIIVKVPETDFEFLTWDLTHWIESLVFSRSITYVDNIKIESAEVTETFRFAHHPNDNPNLVVVGDECGEISDITNFREFYKTLLYVDIKDYAPEDVDIKEENCILRFTVTTLSGNVTEYAFYQYSTRRCLLTINGEGQFYTFVDVAQKVINDTVKVMHGIEIDSIGKN